MNSVQAEIIMNLINCPDMVVDPLSYFKRQWKHYYYILPISYSKGLRHRVLTKSHRAYLTENAAEVLGLVLLDYLQFKLIYQDKWENLIKTRKFTN